MVAGAGVALLRASRVLPPGDEGADIVRRACEEPIRQICTNAGLDPTAAMLQVLKRNEPAYGVNVLTGAFGDLMAAKIMDPARVARTALEIAATTSCRMLAGGAFIRA